MTANPIHFDARYVSSPAESYSSSPAHTVPFTDFYCPIYREEEREMIRTCQSTGVGIIPWSPLARGYVTRPHREQHNTERAKSDPNFAKFVGLGDETGELSLSSTRTIVGR